MYNRYVRSNNGDFTRMPQQDTTPPPKSKIDPPPPPTEPIPPVQPPSKPPQIKPPPEKRLFDSLLSKIHLQDIDSGDLLLLLILFLLFRQDADEEVLIAIGLLLIL